MLFNSLVFIFAFLPLVFAGYVFAHKMGSPKYIFSWLALSSIIFYSWWNIYYLPLLLFVIVSNYFLSILILKYRDINHSYSKLFLMLGISFNVLFLGVFKYTDFIIGTVNSVVGYNFSFFNIALPLAISFIAFQKIAYLVDCYKGQARAKSFLEYVLFVTFFPQLIAGPIVHYREVMPQFDQAYFSKINWTFVCIGVSLFFVGLFKKCVLADGAGVIANTIYGAVGKDDISIADAWMGVFGYSFQIYFDFSGYSDMAIGLGMIFGIRLPDNFRSPYKATNIIEFWKCWHMTLSRFLKDYIYIPLGGNRCNKIRQGINVSITMLIGGLWHGASWNFVIWGGLHGVLIVFVHFLKNIMPNNTFTKSIIFNFISIVMTFVLVSVIWVFFRTENMEDSFSILRGLVNINGSYHPLLLDHIKAPITLALLSFIVWGLPNSMEVYLDSSGERDKAFSWRISYLFAALSCVFFVLSILFMQSHMGKVFIYFEF